MRVESRVSCSKRSRRTPVKILSPETDAGPRPVYAPTQGRQRALPQPRSRLQSQHLMAGRKDQVRVTSRAADDRYAIGSARAKAAPNLMVADGRRNIQKLARAAHDGFHTTGGEGLILVHELKRPCKSQRSVARGDSPFLFHEHHRPLRIRGKGIGDDGVTLAAQDGHAKSESLRDPGDHIRSASTNWSATKTPRVVRAEAIPLGPS